MLFRLIPDKHKMLQTIVVIYFVSYECYDALTPIVFEIFQLA